MPISPSTEPKNEHHSETEKKEKNDLNLSFLPKDPTFKLDDIVLPDATKSALLDAISFFRYQDLIFDKWGLSDTHKSHKKMAVNFYGPPGTGKTMAAHASAHHLNKKIIEVSYAEIESKYVGDTPKNLEKVFKKAEEEDCILFFDEADAVLSRRVTNMNSSTDVSVNQTRSVLLMLLNNFSGSVIFATNFIKNYDPAFMRRMLASVEFKMPDLQGRIDLWRRLIPEKLPAEIDIREISEQYQDVTGSDISNAILSASLRSARIGKASIPSSFFEEAIEKIKAAKEENAANDLTITKRKISEKHALEQLK